MINLNTEIDTEIKEMQFTEIKERENDIHKNMFKYSNKNLTQITEDFQGIEYTEISRKKYMTYRKRHHSNFRCMPINPKEKTIHKDFIATKKFDIFYSFEKFYKNLAIHITHFQVRKNFLRLKDDEVAYTTVPGIQSFNFSNKTTTDLCNFSFNNEPNPNVNLDEQGINMERYVICFDITETIEGNYLIATGNSDGSVRLLKINKDELNNIRTKRFLEKKTKYDVVCSEIIAHGLSDEILTNYVKFIEKGKYLLTTSNDCNIRIYSLEEKLIQIANYKSEFPINHCSMNYNMENDRDFKSTLNSGNNILASVGDSQFIELFDLHNKTLISKFKGHYDIGTVIRFLGNEYDFATGNQDKTCKIWDIRKVNNLLNTNTIKMEEPVKTLCGNLDSIGDIAIINKDMFAFFENKDYFHVYNMKENSFQSVNYCGFFTGIFYQKCYDKLHVAVKESHYSGILTFSPIKSYTNSLDNLVYL